MSVFGNDPVLVMLSDVVTALVDNGAESLFTVISSIKILTGQSVQPEKVTAAMQVSQHDCIENECPERLLVRSIPRNDSRFAQGFQVKASIVHDDQFAVVAQHGILHHAGDGPAELAGTCSGQWIDRNMVAQIATRLVTVIQSNGKRGASAHKMQTSCFCVQPDHLSSF